MAWRGMERSALGFFDESPVGPWLGWKSAGATIERDSLWYASSAAPIPSASLSKLPLVALRCSAGTVGFQPIRALMSASVTWRQALPALAAIQLFTSGA
jgi:hypothetical protein